MEGGSWFYAVVADWSLRCRRGLHGRSLSTLNDWRSPVHCKKVALNFELNLIV